MIFGIIEAGHLDTISVLRYNTGEANEIPPLNKAGTPTFVLFIYFTPNTIVSNHQHTFVSHTG